MRARYLFLSFCLLGCTLGSCESQECQELYVESVWEKYSSASGGLVLSTATILEQRDTSYSVQIVSGDSSGFEYVRYLLERLGQDTIVSILPERILTYSDLTLEVLNHANGRLDTHYLLDGSAIFHLGQYNQDITPFIGGLHHSLIFDSDFRLLAYGGQISYFICRSRTIVSGDSALFSQFDYSGLGARLEDSTGTRVVSRRVPFLIGNSESENSKPKLEVLGGGKNFKNSLYRDGTVDSSSRDTLKK